MLQPFPAGVDYLITRSKTLVGCGTLWYLSSVRK